jgi:adenylate kinase family enzyme
LSQAEKNRDKQEFIDIQTALLNESAWVVEGCSFSTFESALRRLISIYFDFPRIVCLFRLFKRLFDYKEEYGGLRTVTWEVLKYTWRFDQEKRPKIDELRQKYPQTRFLIFRRQKEGDRFLNSLTTR